MDISFYRFERLPPRCLYLTRTLFLYSFEPWNILDLKRSDIRCGQEFFIKKIYPNRVEYFYPRKRTPKRNVNLRLICNQFYGIKLTRHAITRNISLSLSLDYERRDEKGTRWKVAIPAGRESGDNFIPVSSKRLTRGKRRGIEIPRMEWRCYLSAYSTR